MLTAIFYMLGIRVIQISVLLLGSRGYSAQISRITYRHVGQVCVKYCDYDNMQIPSKLI